MRPAVEDERGRGDWELDLLKGERLEDPLMRILIIARARCSVGNREEGGKW